MNDRFLMLYIAAWGWQILAILFLCTAFIITLLGNTPLGASFVLVFAGCEFVSLYRKRKLENE